LSLPTNFPTPVSNNGAAGAFAALAQTAGNIADFKQHLFDREQAAYEERAYGEARIKAQVFFNETSQAVSQSITKENYRYKDGDAPVRTGMEGKFKDPSFYDSIEGYPPLTPRNQEIVRNKIQNEYLVRAAQADENYRTAGRKLTEQTNYDNNRLVIATVSPEVSLNEDGGINFSKDYVTALKKAFVHADQYNLDKDRIGSDFVLKLVTPENIELGLKNPGFAKALVAEAKAVMSDSSGQSFVNTPVLASLDKFSSLVTTEREKAIKAFADEHQSRFNKNAIATKLPETLSEFKNSINRHLQLLEFSNNLKKDYGNFLSGDTKDNILKLENRYAAMASVYNFVSEDPSFPKGAKDEEVRNELLKKAPILQRLTTASSYYKSLEGLSVEEDNKRNEVVKLLGDLIENTNAQSHLENAATFDLTLQDTTLLNMLKESQEAVLLEPSYDRNVIKWPRVTLDKAVENYISFRDKDESFFRKNEISKEAVDLFTISVLNNLDDKQKLDAVLSSSDQSKKYNPEIFEDLNNVTGESLGFVDSENWAKSIFGPQVGLVLAGSVSKSINIVHARLQNDVEYNDLVVKYNKSDADGKEKLAPQLKRRLAKEYANAIDRTYIEGMGVDGFLMLDKKAFPTAEYAAETIDAGRIAAANLLLGNSGGTLDKILNYPVVPDTDFLVEKTVAETKGQAIPKRLPSSDEMLKMLEEADWSGSHPSVKASFISAAKSGALINSGAVIRKVKQNLDALRSSGQIAVDSSGQLHFSYRVGGEGGRGGKVVKTTNQTASSLSAILGEQGMQNVRLRSRNFFGKMLQLENPFGDPIKDIYDIDAAMPYDLQSPEEVREYSRNFMYRVDWNDAVEVGKNVSANGVIRKLTEGDYTAYQITGDVASYLDFSKSAATIARVHGSSPYANTQNAHTLSRMFAPIIDLYANQADTNINLSPSSISFNQHTQNIVEEPIVQEIEKVIEEGKADGLKAEWNIVTYNPSLGAIEKGGFGEVSEGVSTPILSAIQWRLQFKDDSGTAVYTWEYSIEDKEVLNLASRNNLFLTD
jgi:hypothetical protein